MSNNNNGMVDYQHKRKGQWCGSNRTEGAMLDIHKRRHAKDALYRSNSSLELVHTEHHYTPNTLRREYGSHGSIDVIGSPTSTGESFFAMLQDCHPSSIPADQRSPGPSEYLPLKMDPLMENANNNPLSVDCQDGINCKNAIGGSSPKLKLKFHKFWSGGASVGKPHRNQMPLDDSALNTSSCYSSINSSCTDVEDMPKRRSFAHYDCQSLTANLGYAAKLRGILLGRRRNTTTGASAASMVTSKVVDLDGDTEEDSGDGQTNDLIESCPFFRNEIGGEEERNMSLNWKTGRSKKSDNANAILNMCMHQPSVAYGLSILEFPPGQSHWKQTCHLARRTINIPRPIQLQDQGALYYRKYFYGQEHQNWFGMDEQLGPVAISLKKEKMECVSNNNDVPSNSNPSWQYRLIVRTSELSTLRGSILEESIPNIKPSSNNNKLCNTKELLEYIAPEIQLNCLRLGLSNSGAEEQLLRLDEQCVSRHYKVGIMYCRAGQSTEEDMYNNQEAGPAFVEFLQMIGQTVRLNGFDKYKAGLDNKTDSTGLYSVYTVYQDYEIMFHVSTMLPYTPNNRQQLLRKRHIGNDIVTIVFQEPGAQKFTPKNIRSQFQHVFIVVGVVNPCSDNTHYSIAVSRSKEVPIFGPPIIEGGLYPKGKAFTDLLLAKVINGENAAHQSTKFSTMATRTRQEYLKDLAKNYITTTPLDTGQKFSLFSSLLKSGSSTNNNVVGGVRPLGTCLPEEVSGALCWSVVARDEGRAGAMTDCFLGLSRDTFVLIEECSRQIVFVTPTKAILGWRWWMDGAGIRVYFHRGESLAFRGRDTSARELARALASAAPQASPAIQLQLRRNHVGQLGFHVQPDGVVTQVEAGGGAARAGLCQGCRLVEICTVAVCTLSHDQMVDLLKTSAPVTVTAIPPLPGSSGTPRGICTSPDCPATSCTMGGSQLPGRHRRRYDPSFSPPRSGTSSGYGTGSSSKSYRPLENWNSEDTDRSNDSTIEDNKLYNRSIESTYLKKSDSIETNKILLSKRHSQEIVNNNMPEFRNEKCNLSEGGEYSTRVSNILRNNNNSSPGRPQNNFNDYNKCGGSEGADYSPRVSLVVRNTGSPNVIHKPQNSGSPVETRLRAPRGQRHSTGPNSNLQEELMRLINPDYVEAGSGDQGLLLQARPATVISSTSSGGSPAPTSLSQAPPLPLPDARLMDWPSLVDTATRAMLQICEEQYPSLDVEGSTTGSGCGVETSEGVPLGEMVLPGEECCPLRRQLKESQNMLEREIRARKVLEEEVKRLRQHNRRLREESVRAVQQLQRFTNWFFQTVERQQ